MNCSQIAKSLPDYRLGGGNLSRRRAIEAHLNVCEACREQLEIWENFCTFSAHQIRIPKTLDWSPLEQALEAEMRRTHSVRVTASNQRKAVSFRGLRSTKLRRFSRPPLLAGAAALVILSLWMINSIPQPQPKLKHRLTLGSEIVAQASHGELVYREARTTQIYHQETGKIVPAQDNIPNWQDIPDQPE